MRLAQVVVLFVAIVSIIVNYIDILSMVSLLISTILTCWILKTSPLKLNPTKYLVLFSVWMSVVAMPAFHLVIMVTGLTDRRSLVQIDYDHLCCFGAHVYLATVLFCFFLVRTKLRQKIIYIYTPIHISERYINIFLISLYILTAFSYSIGLGRMGGEQIALPYHLSGIINLYRSALAPSVFMLIVENYCMRKKTIPQKYIIVVFGWCVFETLAWLSKAILINYLIGPAFVYFLYYRPSLKIVLKKAFPMIMILFMLYPIIGFLRYADKDSGSLLNNIMEARSMAKDANENSEVMNPFIRPLNRIFMTGSQYVRNYDYIKDDDFFDFSRAGMVISSGGAAAFQTYIIDGYDTEAHHSSGTTGIMDPLLHGGRGLCIVVIGFIMFLASFVDNQMFKHRFSIFVKFLLMVLGLVLFGNISSLYDAVGLQGYIVSFLSIFLIYYVNFRKYYKYYLNQ